MAQKPARKTPVVPFAKASKSPVKAATKVGKGKPKGM